MAIAALAVYRTWHPTRLDDGLVHVVPLLGELAVILAAVVATGFWDSPFVFCLITPIVITGFARGLAPALLIAMATSVIVGGLDLARDGDLRISGQWAGEFVLVALVAGYARRISGEADRQQGLAFDRLGRLADANALLFNLHRVAQTLPASLDYDETLDSTLGRLRDLFTFSAAAILLHDDSDGSWRVVRRDGCRLPERYTADELPPPISEAVLTHGDIGRSNLLAEGGPGLVPQMYSGIYMALRARGVVIGVVSLEHNEADHYTARDGELLSGFAEPAALAIDNARWFARLRTVGAEEERTRIARDLHDRIGQSLAYLAFELDRIVKSERKGDPISSSLNRLRSDLRDVIREVRDTLYDLRTDVSEQNGLVAVLELYAQRVRERSGLEINVRSEATSRLPLLQEREVFRIAQEALANIEKHASATSVAITWQRTSTTAVLEVADDGIGFPIGKAGRLDSYGLIGMRERADSIGAHLDITSQPGAGTRVRCVLTAKTRAPAAGNG